MSTGRDFEAGHAVVHLHTRDHDVAARFDQGDYVTAALHGAADQWQHFAALGLIKDPKQGIAGLEAFDDDDAAFYKAVLYWMDGDEDAAIRGLEAVGGDHAGRLVELIRQPRIRVIAQLPPLRGASFAILEGIDGDRKFAVRTVGFEGSDVPFRPYQSVREFYDPARPPAFFVSGMIEWHYIPVDIHELPCPTIGHTSDFDLHIQGLRPWLRAFDHMLVCDHTVEWEGVRRISDRPTYAYPMVFGAPSTLPVLPTRPRDIDVFASGTLIQAYQPDKARLTNQLMDIADLNMLLVNGHMFAGDYYDLLGRAKIVPTYCRHPGALLTRAIEAMAMGCIVLVQPDSIHRLWSDETNGLFVYDEERGPGPVVARILNGYKSHAARAERHAAAIRRNFSPDVLASRYFRYCTVLAARPTAPREAARFRDLTQKRNMFVRGWSPPPDAVAAIAEANIARMEAQATDGASAAIRNDQARELLLAYGHRLYLDADGPADQDLLDRALCYLRSAVAERPNALVPRFNLMRALLHFGGPAQIQEGLDVARDVRSGPIDRWVVSADDDVFPYDLFPLTFDYRTYLDLVVEMLQSGADLSVRLRELVLAAVDSYYGVLIGDPAPLERACALAPDHPVYPLQLASVLLATPSVANARKARRLLAPLTKHSFVSRRAWRVLMLVEERIGERLPERLQLDRKFRHGARAFLHIERYSSELHSHLAQRSNVRRLGTHGVLVHKDARGRQAVLSVIICSAGGHGVEATLTSLLGQGVPRDRLEIIIVECFDMVATDAIARSDIVVSCNMPLFVEHRSIAFNAGLERATAGSVIAVEAGTALGPPLLQSALARIVGSRERQAMVLETAGAAPVLAVRTQDLRATGGFDQAEPYQGEMFYLADAIARLAASGVEVVWLQRGPLGEKFAAGQWTAAVAQVRPHAAIGFIGQQWPKVLDPARAAPRPVPVASPGRRLLLHRVKTVLRQRLPPKVYMRLGRLYRRAQAYARR